LIDDQDESDDEEQVNQRREDVLDQKTEDPQNDEKHGQSINTPRHGSFLLIERAEAMP
jgi:hypothetical protein